MISGFTQVLLIIYLFIYLFFIQVRPVDKKLQYQIEKLTRVTASAVDKVGLSEKEEDATQKTEDPLKYRPNPDMLVSKTNPTIEVSTWYSRIAILFNVFFRRC